MNTKLLVILTAIIFLLAGCSTKTPGSISDIEENKHQHEKNKINITSQSEFAAYIDSDDRVQFMCYLNGESLHAYDNSICGYYDPQKHSYDNLLVEEEVFGISKNGYDPLRIPHNLKCGVGSLYGWLAVFMMEPFGIKDHTSLDKKGCGYRYTTVDETLIDMRVIHGIYTFMTPFITAGNLHTRKFDRDAFKESIHGTNIESYRDQLFSEIAAYDIEGGFDVIYLEKGDIESNLEDKYSELRTDKSKKAGVIFLDDDTRELISIVVFDKYKEKSIMESISLQIEDVMHSIASRNQYTLKNDDIIKHIPTEIIFPALPEIPQLSKSEFEKKSEFNKRIEKAVANREAKIRDLQREYSTSVQERNNYIDALQKSYENYLNDAFKNKKDLVNEVQNNIPLLAKVLFLENISGYEAKEFYYNAETEQFFFKINSVKGGYSQSVVANVSASSAKNIKQNASFKILPEIEYVNNALQLKGFTILDTTCNNSFVVSYTDINYTPERVTVSVVGKKENINKEVSMAFQNTKQKDMQIVDTTNKEIWYIDIANRVNATVPEWFLEPKKTNGIIAFGEGSDLQQAKRQARDELAMMVNVKIDTIFESINIVSDFSTYQESKQSSQQSSQIELSANDYEVYKQDSIDGKWYVALKYLK